jgi:hypothetical protein
MKHGYVVLQFVSSSGNTCDVVWVHGCKSERYSINEVFKNKIFLPL